MSPRESEVATFLSAVHYLKKLRHNFQKFKIGILGAEFFENRIGYLMGTDTSKGYDLRNASFKDFVNFFFDREVHDWYTHHFSDEEYDPSQCVEYFICLFRDPEFLLSEYSSAQVEQGLWVIPSGHFAVTVTSLLAEPKVPPELREACIRAMYFLYRDLFTVDHLVYSAWMWWDQLLEGYLYDYSYSHCPERAGPIHERLKGAAFDTLCEILTLPCEACQWDALHGFNHLKHPGTETVLRHYAAQHPEFSEEEMAFIETCIKGEFQ